MSDRSHLFCKLNNCHVSMDQTEGQCRDQHHCGDNVCPLEKEFARTRFSKALNMMAASIGQVVRKVG